MGDAYATIGGNSPENRNAIGNNLTGVKIVSDSTTPSTIVGNYIGSDSLQGNAKPNGTGISYSADNSGTIKGTISTKPVRFVYKKQENG